MSFATPALPGVFIMRGGGGETVCVVFVMCSICMYMCVVVTHPPICVTCYYQLFVLNVVFFFLVILGTLFAQIGG